MAVRDVDSVEYGAHKRSACKNGWGRDGLDGLFVGPRVGVLGGNLTEDSLLEQRCEKQWE
jgi:hypothetical protein